MPQNFSSSHLYSSPLIYNTVQTLRLYTVNLPNRTLGIVEIKAYNEDFSVNAAQQVPQNSRLLPLIYYVKHVCQMRSNIFCQIL